VCGSEEFPPLSPPLLLFQEVDNIMNTNTSATSLSNNGSINPYYIEFQAGVTAILRSWSALRTAVEQSWGGSDSYSKAEDLRLNIYSNFHSSSDNSSSNKKIMTQEELEDNLLLYMEDEFGVVLEDGSEVEVATNICQMYNDCRNGNVELARKTVQIALQAEEQAKLMTQNDNNTSFTMGGVKNIFLEEGGEATINDEEDDDEDYVDGDDDNMEEDESDSSGDEEYDDDDDDDDFSRGVNQEEEVVMQDVKNDNDDGTDCNTQSLAESLAQAYAAGSLFGGPTKPRKTEPPPRQLGEPKPEKAQPLVDEDGFAPVMTRKKKSMINKGG